MEPPPQLRASPRSSALREERLASPAHDLEKHHASSDRSDGRQQSAQCGLGRAGRCHHDEQQVGTAWIGNARRLHGGEYQYAQRSPSDDKVVKALHSSAVSLN
jgi:hypothetical protein